MDKCMENNTQMFIKDKSHMTKVYVTVVPLFGLPLQSGRPGPGPFLYEQTEYLKFM